MNKLLKSSSCMAASAVAMVALAAGQASAQDDKVSGTLGYNYNSHFISYGFDVWGAGGDLFDDQATSSVFGSVSWAVADPLVITAGFWTDINDNAPASIGGDWQELDVYIGAAYTAGKFTFGGMYQEWNYAADVEKIVDLSVAFNDEGLLPIKLNPSVVWHNRIEGNGAQTDGSAVVASVKPGFELGFATLSVPVGVAFFVDEDFQGGDDTYGYAYGGGSLAIPMTFIPEDLGPWALTFDLIYYATNEDAIPTNPEENFLTGSIGFTTSF